MTISLITSKYAGAIRVDAEVISIQPKPASEFYSVEVEWPDGERETIMMAYYGLDRFCPDWRSFRRAQITAPRGPRQR